MKWRIKSANLGFTIIELMITVTIMLVLFGGSLSSYFTFSNSQAMDTDARLLTTELNRIKSLAANMSYPSGCSTLTGYRVQGLINTANLTVTALCGSGNVSSSVTGLLKSSVFNAAFNITFLPGTGYLSSGAETTFVIRNSSSATDTRTISISLYGSAFQLYD